MSNPLVRVFNQQFADFIADVRAVFPDNADVLLAQKAFTSLCKANPKLLCKLWKQHVSIPYASEIERGDVNFFIHRDYSADVAGQDKSDQIIESITKIRSIIHDMSDENMQTSMRYVQNLTRLSAAIN